MNTSLDSILSNAASGMRASQAGITVLSDNIANAGVAGYTAKQLDTAPFLAGGQVNGVRTGLVTRSVDEALQANVWSSASSVGALTTRSQVLNAVNATQGTPGDGTSLADAVSALQSGFTLLQSQPSDTTQQSSVVAAAGTLARTLTATAGTIATERNAVQGQIVAAVDTLNTALATVQTTTQALIAAGSANQDTASLQDQRDTALQTLSGMMSLHYDKQANGDITILGQNGLTIPLSSRFSTASAVLTPASSYTPGGASVPAILLQSSNAATPPADVTNQVSGGQLGELIQLRDKTLPAYTASLDSFSANLANRFSAQGLQLFTDGSGIGAANLAATPGLSSQIEVNPAVLANPALVRDGTSGSLNPSGLAGFSDVIDNVLTTTFAASGATPGLAASAQSFVSQQSTATGQATTDLTSATSYQTTVSAKFADGSGVNVDDEMGLMIQLQNSYQANARVVQATQTMFTTLMDATRSL
jgi:flagellar hook-associated protein 1 FlgK